MTIYLTAAKPIVVAKLCLNLCLPLHKIENKMFDENFDPWKAANLSEVIQKTAEKPPAPVTPVTAPLPKSQRYLEDPATTASSEDYANVPQATKNFFAKKLPLMIEKQVEFCNFEHNVRPSLKKPKKRRNNVRLLLNADCYVLYEGVDYANDVQKRKKPPAFQRRAISPTDAKVIQLEEKLSAAAISPADLLSGAETAAWAAKPKSERKVLHYRRDRHGILRAQDVGS